MTSRWNTWIMTQTWEHLLFAHWPVPAEVLRRLVPSELELDTFEGQAWLGVIPFWMSEVRLRFLPVLPFTTRFPQINVRTYVKGNGKPGVFFISLYAANGLIVNASRLWQCLPYYTADMSMELRADAFHFRSERKNSAPAHQFRCSYKPDSLPFTAKAGTLEHWLIERYHLYYRCSLKNRIYQGDIRHEPWELQRAQAEIAFNTLTDEYGFTLPAAASPLLHYSRGVKARIWPVYRFMGYRDGAS